MKSLSEVMGYLKNTLNFSDKASLDLVKMKNEREMKTRLKEIQSKFKSGNHSKRDLFDLIDIDNGIVVNLEIFLFV
jgi:hypothetical protein